MSLTTRNKLEFLFRHYDVKLLGTIIEENFRSNKQLVTLFNKWLDGKSSSYTDTNEGILLIELLYNITKNKSKNT